VSAPMLAFLGPSLPSHQARALAPCRVLPPARAGDIWKALALRPRVIVLIDGVFESQPSVWHREILDALACGVAVFGASSMGALRAVELQAFGMVGVGEIFAAFRDGRLIDDSEVALLHADAEHGFRRLTEPLVNVRHHLARARAAKVISKASADRVLKAAEGLFYQDRTWPKLLDAARLSPDARQRLAAFPREDLKAKDARACLVAASDFLASGAWQPPLRRPQPPSHARRRRTESSPRSTDADAGLRRALIAAYARDSGLDARADAQVLAGLLAAGVEADRAGRLAEDVALERLSLDWAARLVNDGPSPAEASADEALLSRIRSGRGRSASGRPAGRPRG
jgi:hypothetical protein